MDNSRSLPLVSIIIPSYNHGAYVQQGIRAALNQTYPATEVIVIDDASTDHSPELLDRLSRELGFRLIQNARNLGLNASLQAGLEIARGTYVSMIASDDMLAPDKVALGVEYLERTRYDAVFATGWLLFSDGRSQCIDLDAVSDAFERGTILEKVYCDDTSGPLMQSALIRRDVVLSLWPERARFKSDDWVMLIRLLERHRVGFINRPVFFYRQHEENTYRKYWATLPMRVDVIANVTPEAPEQSAISH